VRPVVADAQPLGNTVWMNDTAFYEDHFSQYPYDPCSRRGLPHQQRMHPWFRRNLRVRRAAPVLQLDHNGRWRRTRADIRSGPGQPC
jgi:hypothetical protein